MDQIVTIDPWSVNSRPLGSRCTRASRRRINRISWWWTHNGRLRHLVRRIPRHPNPSTPRFAATNGIRPVRGPWFGSVAGQRQGRDRICVVERHPTLRHLALVCGVVRARESPRPPGCNEPESTASGVGARVVEMVGRWMSPTTPVRFGGVGVVGPDRVVPVGCHCGCRHFGCDATGSHRPSVLCLQRKLT